MAGRKVRYFEMNSSDAGFVSRLKGEKKDIDFSDLKDLRNIITNEKGRILHTLKTKQPESIYQLAKLLKRDLKSIRTDVKALERFGFIEFVSKKTGKRISHKPVLVVDRMEFILKV
jgi:predicted transcriptional regulator